MSEKRSTKDILEDYNKLAFKSGHLQYTISAHEKDLEKINSAMQDLNLEYVAAKNVEDAASAAETPKEGT